MAKISKKDVQITKELQKAVEKNKRIKNVYFSENGDHYFTAHKVDVHTVNDMGESIKVTKVDSLPGAKFGIAKVKMVQNGKPVLRDKRVNVEVNEVACTLTREEILSANAVPQSRTEKQKMEILAAAAEIIKGDDYGALLGKLNAEQPAGKQPAGKKKPAEGASDLGDQ